VRRLPPLLAAIALLLGVLAQPAGATFVPAGRPPLSAFSHLVVDEAHSHLFFSQGTSTVVVTDLSGDALSSLGSLAGSTDLLMDPSGGTVWVALSTGAGVAAIDTGDLSVTTYPLGAGTCPSRLAVVDAHVWVVSQCGLDAAELYRLTPGAGTVSDVGAIAPGAVVAGSPQLPGVLVTAYPTDVGATAQELDVTATPGQAPTVLAENDGLGSPPVQIAVSADGTKVVTSRGVVLRSEDLSLGHDRGDPTVETGLAVRSDGQVAYADLQVVHGFRLPGGTTLVDVGVSPAQVLPFGIGYGAHDVYVVTSDDTGFGVTPVALRLPPLFDIDVDATHVRYGGTVGVSVVAQKAPAQAPIDLYARPKGGPTQLVAQGQLDADLQFHTSYVVKADETLTASFAGNADWAPFSDDALVAVRPVMSMSLSGELRISHGVYVYRAGSRIHAAMAILPRDTGGCVRVRLQEREAGHWRPYESTECTPVSAKGRATAVLGHTGSLVGADLRVSARLFDHPRDVPEAHTRWTGVTVVR
jgi:hypothetical protein